MTDAGTVVGDPPGRQNYVRTDGHDLARMLVSELSGVCFEEVVFGKRYMTEQLGALCFLVAKQEDGRGIVDIGGNYSGIPEWAFVDEIVSKCPAYEPLVQIDCSVFDDGAVYRMCSRPAKISGAGAPINEPISAPINEPLKSGLHLLQIIRDNPGLRKGELARLSGIHSSNVKRLIEGNLLLRQQNMLIR